MTKRTQSEKYYYRVIKILSVLTRGISRGKTEGLDRLPETGAVIIAPNHISNIDPILLGVQLAKRRQIHALGKDSLFRAPVIGKVITKMGHIPVHRGTSSAGLSLDTAEDMLKSSGAVAIYPEGTIPRDMSGKLGKLKTGVARLAQKTGTPVVPVGQVGAEKVLPLTGNPLLNILKSFLKRPRHNIVVGEPIFYLSGETVEAFNSRLALALTELINEAQKL